MSEPKTSIAHIFQGLDLKNMPPPPELERWESEGGSLPPTALETGNGDNAHRGKRFHGSVAVSDALPLGVMITDAYGNCVYSNAALERLTGRSSSRLLGSHWISSIHIDDRLGLVRDWEEAMRQHRPFVVEARLTRLDGTNVWIRQTITVVNESRQKYGHAHTIEDVSASREQILVQQKKQQHLAEENTRAQITLDCIGDAVICTDTAGCVTYMNVVAEQLTGCLRAVSLGKPLGAVFKAVDATTRKPVPSPAQRAIETRSIVALAANSVLIRSNGKDVAIEDSAAPIYDQQDQLTGAVIVFHDAKFSAEAASRMAHLAEHDSLTGLCNRNALKKKFAQSQRLAKRHRKQMSILFIDLDNFKSINDQLGHESGDRLLVSLSKQLVGAVRETDIVCRYGGDEFVILLSEIEQPDHGEDVENLIRVADSEMYRAKAAGKRRTSLATVV
ncbi:MAG: diguanylate cyclase [Natronospirillum sp.]